MISQRGLTAARLLSRSKPSSLLRAPARRAESGSTMYPEGRVAAKQHAEETGGMLPSTSNLSQAIRSTDTGIGNGQESARVQANQTHDIELKGPADNPFNRERVAVKHHAAESAGMSTSFSTPQLSRFPILPPSILPLPPSPSLLPPSHSTNTPKISGANSPSTS